MGRRQLSPEEDPGLGEATKSSSAAGEGPANQGSSLCCVSLAMTRGAPTGGHCHHGEGRSGDLIQVLPPASSGLPVTLGASSQPLREAAGWSVGGWSTQPAPAFQILKSETVTAKGAPGDLAARYGEVSCRGPGRKRGIRGTGSLTSVDFC